MARGYDSQPGRNAARRTPHTARARKASMSGGCLPESNMLRPSTPARRTWANVGKVGTPKAGGGTLLVPPRPAPQSTGVPAIACVGDSSPGRAEVPSPRRCARPSVCVRVRVRVSVTEPRDSWAYKAITHRLGCLLPPVPHRITLYYSYLARPALSCALTYTQKTTRRPIGSAADVPPLSTIHCHVRRPARRHFSIAGEKARRLCNLTAHALTTHLASQPWGAPRHDTRYARNRRLAHCTSRAAHHRRQRLPASARTHRAAPSAQPVAPGGSTVRLPCTTATTAAAFVVRCRPGTGTVLQRRVQSTQHGVPPPYVDLQPCRLGPRKRSPVPLVLLPALACQVDPQL
ncbi:hypothetical protein Purlil1_5868 [Purpureocillium lilacinum]|uniref:Uncharacterized protein n=1 Tax=Purpureocillium lilacinum TaxID=33203 RepID=A0ABR0C0M0_PURLI|nr:hypothetical protein Purlil1_5868 [Purpureocillium lilacinum]